MRMCRVLGSITSTVKLPCFLGLKLMVVEPVDETGKATGKSFIAVDRAQAGEGDRVLVMSEGTGVRQLFGVPKTADLPIRSVIVGIVDQVDAPPVV
ncbi:MAG: EutN/CcmL family microcompartment protein [Deltaproteobacteria bacterium]|nr:EutN/CcmL family microcompartment protein [Deltaproteobacteria bacterium]